MKTILALTLVGMFTASVYALPDYEPFADATGSGGTSYTVGANLIGQTDAQGQTWFQAGPVNATQPKIVAGNLSYPGLPASQGNSVSFGGNGDSARINLTSPVGSGTIYYSFIMDVTSTRPSTPPAIFFGGFQQLRREPTTTPSTVATRLYARTVAGGFQLGVDKNSASTSDWTWDSTVRTVGTTLFIVGAYTINSASTIDDVSQLWINPDTTLVTPPTANATDSTGPDITLNQVCELRPVRSFCKRTVRDY